MSMYTIVAMMIFTFVLLILMQYRWLPLKWFGRCVWQLMVGAIILYGFNVVAGFYHFHIPLNLVTVGVAGFLGLPGVVSLACIKWFFI